MFRVIRYVFASLLLLALGGSSIPATGNKMDYPRVPASYREMADKIPKAALWKDRVKVFRDLKTLVEKNADALPESIPDSRIGEAQTLMELKVLFGEVNEESLSPARCASTRNLVAFWSSPQAESEETVGELGRFVISVVRSVCGG